MGGCRFSRPPGPFDGDLAKLAATRTVIHGDVATLREDTVSLRLSEYTIQFCDNHTALLTRGEGEDIATLRHVPRQESPDMMVLRGQGLVTRLYYMLKIPSGVPISTPHGVATHMASLHVGTRLTEMHRACGLLLLSPHSAG